MAWVGELTSATGVPGAVLVDGAGGASGADADGGAPDGAGADGAAPDDAAPDGVAPDDAALDGAAPDGASGFGAVSVDVACAFAFPAHKRMAAAATVADRWINVLSPRPCVSTSLRFDKTKVPMRATMSLPQRLRPVCRARARRQAARLPGRFAGFRREIDARRGASHSGSSPPRHHDCCDPTEHTAYDRSAGPPRSGEAVAPVPSRRPRPARNPARDTGSAPLRGLPMRAEFVARRCRARPLFPLELVRPSAAAAKPGQAAATRAQNARARISLAPIQRYHQAYPHKRAAACALLWSGAVDRNPCGPERTRADRWTYGTGNVPPLSA